LINWSFTKKERRKEERKKEKKKERKKESQCNSNHYCFLSDLVSFLLSCFLFFFLVETPTDSYTE